jgi:FtsP/CotA-like multicopper oxidase with cupredoxin domain
VIFAVLQQSDGVYGALIVRAPSEIKYEEDHVLIISPWSDEIQSGAYGVLHGDLLRQTMPTALLVNGRGAMQTVWFIFSHFSNYDIFLLECIITVVLQRCIGE